MSPRGLLVLVVLLAAVIGALVWLDRREEPPKASAPEAPLVNAFAEDSVQEIDLECGGSAVRLSRSPRGWRIARPAESEADPRRVHELLAALQDARARKTIAGEASHAADYGLAPPVCRVRVTSKTPAPVLSLRLGRTSPVGTERYAALDDDRVVLTDGSLYGVLSRGAAGFRERRLIPVEADEITRIVLDRPDGRLALAADSGAWRLEAPRPDAASSGACGALARALATLELLGEESVRSPGAAPASRRLRVEIAARGRNTPIVALVAAAGIDGKRLGWREDGTLAGVVAESAAHELERSWESFREARIASFSVPDVRALTLSRQGATLRLVRAGEASPWSGTEGPAAFAVDGVRVEDLLEKLRGLTADGFEPRDPGTKEAGTIVVAGEHDELARLAWGPLASASGSEASSVWITTPARPGAVFRVDARSFGPIPAHAADLAPTAAEGSKTAAGS